MFNSLIYTTYITNIMVNVRYRSPCISDSMLILNIYFRPIRKTLFIEKKTSINHKLFRIIEFKNNFSSFNEISRF